MQLENSNDQLVNDVINHNVDTISNNKERKIEKRIKTLLQRSFEDNIYIFDIRTYNLNFGENNGFFNAKNRNVFLIMNNETSYELFTASETAMANPYEILAKATFGQTTFNPIIQTLNQNIRFYFPSFELQIIWYYGRVELYSNLISGVNEQPFPIETLNKYVIPQMFNNTKKKLRSSLLYCYYGALTGETLITLRSAVTKFGFQTCKGSQSSSHQKPPVSFYKQLKKDFPKKFQYLYLSYHELDPFLEIEGITLIALGKKAEILDMMKFFGDKKKEKYKNVIIQYSDGRYISEIMIDQDIDDKYTIHL